MAFDIPLRPGYIHLYQCNNIGIKMGFHALTFAKGRGFQHLPRDLANFNALKTHVRSLLLHKN